MTALFIITSNNKMPQSLNLSSQISALSEQVYGKTVLSINYRGRGLYTGPALAIGRAGACLGPRTLRKSLHNITHPLYASPPVKMDNTSLIVHWI